MAGKTQKNAHLWERADNDWYVEERGPTHALLQREAVPGGAVWDPCCGRGHILAEAQAAGYEAWGSDLIDRRRVVDCPFVQGAFEHFPVALAPTVIMNPPYFSGRGIEQFVRQAMRYRSVEKIAAFVPAKWLWSERRAREMHTALPPLRVYMITPRPSCPPGAVWEHAPEEVGGGSEDFAWAVWERSSDGCWPEVAHMYADQIYTPPTQLLWIT